MELGFEINLPVLLVICFCLLSRSVLQPRNLRPSYLHLPVASKLLLIKLVLNLRVLGLYTGEHLIVFNLDLDFIICCTVSQFFRFDRLML